jgi:hypothetical protein
MVVETLLSSCLASLWLLFATWYACKNRVFSDIGGPCRHRVLPRRLLIVELEATTFHSLQRICAAGFE